MSCKLNRLRVAAAATAALTISTYLLGSFNSTNVLQQLSRIVNDSNSLTYTLQREEFLGKIIRSEEQKQPRKRVELTVRDILPFNPHTLPLTSANAVSNDDHAVYKGSYRDASLDRAQRGNDSNLHSSVTSLRGKTQNGSNNYVRLELDTSRGAWAPWPGDPKCQNVTVHFGRRIPVRALASFPGSGNTWVRYLIEGATGIHTGSLYDDSDLYLKGFKGEKEYWDSGTTILQKTHNIVEEDIVRFDGRAVLLIRNPYRALISYNNFFISGGHKSHAPVSFYRSLDWAVFIRVFLREWLLIAKQWLTKGTSVHVLHYELLQEDLTAALTHLLRDLRLPVDSHRLQCLQRHSTGHFLRPPLYLPDNLSVFSPSARDKIERAIHYVNHLLREHQMEELPLRLYEFFNKTASNSIIRVPCALSESRHDCDVRTDELNRAALGKESLPRSSFQSTGR